VELPRDADRIGPVPGGARVPAFVAQYTAQELGQARFVVDDQDADRAASGAAHLLALRRVGVFMAIQGLFG